MARGLLDFLRAEKLPAAVDLEAAIADAARQEAEAVERLEQLGRERDGALLAESDTDLDRIEREIVQQQRRADKYDLVRHQLRERLREAQEAEKRAALDATYNRALEAHDRGVSLIRGRYVELAAELAEVAEELQRLDQEIDAARQELRAAGDRRQVPSVDETARPSSGIPGHYRAGRIYQELVLPSAIDPTRHFYPNGAQLADKPTALPGMAA